MMNDQANRIKALDPTQSFIVQAPAGSGKTELLTQRYLRLLSIVEKAPEEVLAVTFTRKAAAEMRSRIIGALNKAMEPEPTSAHEKMTYALAKEVLKRDKAHNWELPQYPNRLRILTIDAVCSYIANRMPVLSLLGGSPDIADYPKEYYQEAVQRLITQTSEEEGWSNALGQLLLHLDNRISFISNLLENMLAKRDQWLPYLGRLMQDHLSLQMYVNEGIERFIVLHLENLQEQFPSHLKEEIVQLISYAAKKCEENAINSPLVDGVFHSFPQASLDDFPHWLALAELLLTKEGSWRKMFNIKNGFPSQSETKDKQEKLLRKERKDAINALMQELNGDEYLQKLLSEIALLPHQRMQDEQSEILNAMGTLLPVLVAHLQVIFQEKGKIDFVEVNLRAMQALGDELNPTDISLSLDNQIRHILIDEYQDTSSMQYRLFEKLVMGWQQGDGRTLFLVGDPMQSIYKFRGAEVSLFIKTQEQGLGAIKLTPLLLNANFRSSPHVVEWINNAFVSIFPQNDEKSLGGVKFSKAIAQKGNCDNAEVSFYAALSEKEQAEVIVKIISEQLKSHPQESIAVLVKAKRDLVSLISQLKMLRIPFVAVEIEHLATRPHVMDMMSLLRACLDWSDKIAWFAIMRAPWLGLSLADLLIIANATTHGIVWQTLMQYQELDDLSDDGRERIAHFVSIMSYWLDQRQRHHLHAFIRGLWISLCGPYCYQGAHTIQDIDTILKLINNYSVKSTAFSIEDLNERLLQLYADVILSESNDSHIAQLELMTIHKAKGLEFDTVIMPNLQTRAKYQDPELMLWFEHVHEHGIDLMLAPRRAYKEEFSPLYRFVERQISKKSDFEATRLLYVGATRAKKRLYFVAHLDKEQEEYKEPPKGSLLYRLWPHIQIKEEAREIAQAASLKKECIYRLPMAQKMPTPLDKAFEEQRMAQSLDQNIPQATDFTYRAAGIVFHRLMQSQSISKSINTQAIEIALKRQGLYGVHLNTALQLVEQGAQNCFNCEKGQWIISKAHSDRKAEWQLSVQSAKGIDNIIIDCAFVDEHDVRWIIDFKLTHHYTFSENDLKTETEKYRPQLEKYKRVLQKIEMRKIKCALYFPLAKTLYEYD